jgi:hypothetical protein
MSKEEQGGYPLHPSTETFLKNELSQFYNRNGKHNAVFGNPHVWRYMGYDSGGCLTMLSLALSLLAVIVASFRFGLIFFIVGILLVMVLHIFIAVLIIPRLGLFQFDIPMDDRPLIFGIRGGVAVTMNNIYSDPGCLVGPSSSIMNKIRSKDNELVLKYEYVSWNNLLRSQRKLEFMSQSLWIDGVDTIKSEFIEMVERIRQFELDRIAKEKERQRAAAQAFKNRLSNKLQELDKDGNGVVDDIEGDDAFEALLKKHEVLLVEKEKEFSQKFVHKFIRMSSYLTQQRDNIQRIFTLLSKSQNHKSLDENLELLHSEVHTYQVLLYGSINMVTLLADNKVIDFWKTYEVFDALNVYDSNHQRQLSTKLDNIGEGLNELMGSIDRMNLSMSRQLSSLHRLTESNGASMQKQLNSVNSNLKVNNVLNAVQIYQNRKTNKRLG